MASKSSASNQDSTESFHFFSAKESPLHPQHDAEFQVDRNTYHSIEQYILHEKAIFSGASKVAQNILKCKKVDQLKSFEKEIVLDSKKWEEKLKDVTKKGYMAKSLQCKSLNQLLYDSKEKSLAYANPKDSSLGIGLAFNDPYARRKTNWKGKNLLGEWLMEVREEVTSQQLTATEVASPARHTDDEKFTFFFRKESPFSQWHPCTFVVDGIKYNCAEQYMMHQKAVTFGDEYSAREIMASDDPGYQKRLGRSVEKFDEHTWDKVSMEVVKKGNLAKFGQNEHLKRSLFATVGTTLVEASPHDKKWGIGLDALDPLARKRRNWKGENLLGQVLTAVREELMRSESGNKSGGADGKVAVPDGERSMKRKMDDAEAGRGGKNLMKQDPNMQRNIGKNKNISKDQRRYDQRQIKGSNQVESFGNSKEKETERKLDSDIDKQHIRTGAPAHLSQDQEMRNSKSVSNERAADGIKVHSEGSWDKLERNEEQEQEWSEKGPLDCILMEDDIEWNDKREERKSKHHEKYMHKEKFESHKTAKKPIQINPLNTGKSDKFTFFWRADSPFSQHHTAQFYINETLYNCAEQYMMHMKAVVFRDDEIAYEIMNTNIPAKQKSLAKQVRGFDDAHWKTMRREVVKEGNIAKFSQNLKLRRMLFATTGTTLVEASPMDNTWGIGLSADDPRAWSKDTWMGDNLLGKILTEVREELKEKFPEDHTNNRDENVYRSWEKQEKQGDDYDEHYTVFWRPVSPFHPRYPVSFVVDDRTYWTLQQYLAYQKSLHFGDYQTANEILETFRPNKLDELDRKIRNYDHLVWSVFCRSYLRQGNFAKFSQNHNLGQQLIDNVVNGDLVYAVDYDRLLGIGLGDDDRRVHRQKSWRGKNLLGQTLMEVREMLIKNIQTIPEIREEPGDVVTEDIPEEYNDNILAFWKSKLSQWQKCRFTVKGVQYNCAEQYMFHQMAVYFGDRYAEEDVLNCTYAGQLQRLEIVGYDEGQWRRICREVIKTGNWAKFSQDNYLRKELLGTGDAILAYGDKRDLLLGIGLYDNDPLAFDPRNWPGENLLGQVLMEVRNELKTHEFKDEHSGNRPNYSNPSRSDYREHSEVSRKNFPRDQTERLTQSNDRSPQSFNPTHSSHQYKHSASGGQNRRHSQGFSHPRGTEHISEEMLSQKGYPEITKPERSPKSGSAEIHSSISHASHTVGPAQHLIPSEVQSLPGPNSSTEDKYKEKHIISTESPFDLWYKAQFKVDDVTYQSAGQYVYHQKALTFNDGDTAEEIMNLTAKSKLIKMPKRIKNVDEKRWEKVFRDVVKDANFYKFLQNEDLKKELLSHSGCLLVYADPKELMLGVGLKDDDKTISNRNSWKGENMLGYVLMAICDEINAGKDLTRDKNRLLDMPGVDMKQQMSAVNIEEGTTDEQVEHLGAEVGQTENLDKDVKHQSEEEQRAPASSTKEQLPAAEVGQIEDLSTQVKQPCKSEEEQDAPVSNTEEQHQDAVLKQVEELGADVEQCPTEKQHPSASSTENQQSVAVFEQLGQSNADAEHPTNLSTPVEHTRVLNTEMKDTMKAEALSTEKQHVVVEKEHHQDSEDTEEKQLETSEVLLEQEEQLGADVERPFTLNTEKQPSDAPCTEEHRPLVSSTEDQCPIALISMEPHSPAVAEQSEPLGTKIEMNSEAFERKTEPHPVETSSESDCHAEVQGHSNEERILEPGSYLDHEETKHNPTDSSLNLLKGDGDKKAENIKSDSSTTPNCDVNATVAAVESLETHSANQETDSH